MVNKYCGSLNMHVLTGAVPGYTTVTDDCVVGGAACGKTSEAHSIKNVIQLRIIKSFSPSCCCCFFFQPNRYVSLWASVDLCFPFPSSNTVYFGSF